MTDKPARYYVDTTDQWGLVIRDCTKKHPVVGKRGDAPRFTDVIVAAWVDASIIYTLVDTLNAGETSDD